MKGKRCSNKWEKALIQSSNSCENLLGRTAIRRAANGINTRVAEMVAINPELLIFFKETGLMSMSHHMKSGLSSVRLSGPPPSQLVQQQLRLMHRSLITS